MPETQPRLVDRYLKFPDSVIDRRSGAWRQLRSKWSHLTDHGRDGVLYPPSTHDVGHRLHTYSAGASRFDPALAHLLIHWYTRPGDTVIDPFAGGPIRGAVTRALDRSYVGIDLSPGQVAANRAAHPHLADIWATGDAATWHPPPADMVLTCPPYGDLERYSDDPRDLSTMRWGQFTEALTGIVTRTVAALRPDRFAAWVVSDIRDRRGGLRDLPGEIARAHQEAGATWLDDLAVIDPIGSGRLRAKRPFVRGRKTLRSHQRVLVFCAGDAREAAWRVYDQADIPEKAWYRTEGAQL